MKLQNILSENQNYNFLDIKKSIEKLEKKVLAKTNIRIKVSDDDIKKMLKKLQTSQYGVSYIKVSDFNETAKCTTMNGSVTFNHTVEIGIELNDNMIYAVVESEVIELTGICSRFDILLHDYSKLEFEEPTPKGKNRKVILKTYADEILKNRIVSHLVKTGDHTLPPFIYIEDQTSFDIMIAHPGLNDPEMAKKYDFKIGDLTSYYGKFYKIESELFDHFVVMGNGDSLIDNVKKLAQENGDSIRFVACTGVKYKYAKNGVPSFRMSFSTSKLK